MKHLLPCLLLALCAMEVQAQSWTPSTVGEGEFYLYNVGGAGFVKGGTTWGTRATLSTQEAVRFTLVSSGEGYSLSSVTYGGLYLGYDDDQAYVDWDEADVWLFTPVDGLENTYLMQTSDIYFRGSPSTATFTTCGALSESTYDYWQLVTREQLIASLADATDDAPLDATFLLDNPDFSMSTDASLWGSPTIGGATTGSVATYYRSRNAEMWNTTFDCSQTLTDMPQGRYQLLAQGFYRVGGDDNTPTAAAAAREAGTEALNAEFYAGSNSTTVPSIFDGASTTYSANYHSSTGYTINGTTYYVPTNQSRAAYCFDAGMYEDTLDFNVTTSSLTIGVRCQVDNDYQWCCWDNFRLLYYGPLEDLTLYEQQLAEAVAEAQALQGSIPAAAYEQLAEIVATYDKVYTSAADYTEATEAIAAACLALADLQTAYQDYQSMLTLIGGIAAQDVYTDADGAVATYEATLSGIATSVEAALSASEIETLTADVKGAGMTLFSTVAVNDGEAFDFSAFIYNADMASADGWTADTEPTLGTCCGEYYMTAFDISQTLTGMAPGSYRLQVNAFQRPGTNAATYTSYEAGTDEVNAYLYLNTDSVKLLNVMADRADYQVRTGDYECADGTYTPNTLNGATDHFSAGYYVNTLDADVIYSTLNIGISCDDMGDYYWVAFTGFQLLYLGASSERLEQYQAALLAVIKEAESLASDTTYPQNELASLLEAIEAAEEAAEGLSIASMAVAATNLQDAMETYIEANACYHHPQAITLENPTMDDGATMSFPGWTLVNGSTSAGYWDNNSTTTFAGFSTNYMECWVAWGSTLPDNTASQQVTLLKDGYYELSAYVIALQQSNQNLTTTGVDLFMDDDATSCNSLNGIPVLCSVGATKQAGTTSTIGLRIQDTNANWVAWDNVSLLFYGDETRYLLDKLAVLGDSLTALSEALSGALPEAVAQLLVPITPADSLTTTLRTAVAEAENIIAVAWECTEAYADYADLYAQIKAICDVEPYIESVAGAHDTLSSQLAGIATQAEASLTTDELEACEQLLNTIGYAYVRDASPAGDATFDVTFLLTNPDVTDLTTWEEADGWATDISDANCQVMQNDDVSADDGVHVAFYECWTSSPQTDGLLVYQQPTLPAGAYELSCYAFATNDFDYLMSQRVTLSADDYDGAWVESTVLDSISMLFTQASEGTAKLGLRAHANNKANWVGMGYVRLYKRSSSALTLREADAYEPRALLQVDVEMVKHFEGGAWNAIVVPFDASQEALQEALGADVEVAYVYEAYMDGDVAVLDFEKSDIGLVANVPALVRPASDTDTLSFSGVSLSVGTPVLELSLFSLVGNYDGEQQLPDGAYVVDGNQWRLSVAGETVKSFGAYVIADAATSVSSINIIIDGVATSISLIHADEPGTRLDGAYDLSGRRVDTGNLQRGMYIINGKKTLIK